MIKFGETVEIVLQGTNLGGGGIDHPMHLHGFSFYIVGFGFGNYNRAVRLVAAGTGGSGSVNILRQLLFVSLTQETASDAASERRVLRLTPIKSAVAI